MTQAELADHFLVLHRGDGLLLMPNAWDRGSAVLLASLGYTAIATTSSGFAATLGRVDGTVTREEALAHAGDLVDATPLPVSADLENGFADDPAEAAATVAEAVEVGLAGCSIEDYSGRADDRIYDIGQATERVAAAAEAAHAGPVHLVLTARAENHIHGIDDFDDTIARLQAYQQAGADVLFAPGITAADDIRRVVSSVDLPVSVLARKGGPTVAEMAEIGVARVSVGGAFAFAALAAVAEAGRELLDEGTYGYLDRTVLGLREARAAFRS